MAACSEPGPSPSQPEAGSSHAPAVQPSPTPTPTVDEADPSSWVIGFDGVGPVKVGGDITAEAAELTSFTDKSDLAACPVRFLDGPEGPDLALAPDSGGLVARILVMGALWGPHAAAAAAQNSPKIDAGIGADASLAQLMAASRASRRKRRPPTRTSTRYPTAPAGGSRSPT
ncbi:hypothetical protein [Diaminobutyricibacter sp. McL0608]|uniref:hypothetical protein n=1 Tax=Leifsonia sp. McL0608 TaxID=3143537 RepID=UPI0031F2E40D